MGVIYRAPVVGTGTELDPFRSPYGGDPRIGWIDCGPVPRSIGTLAGFGLLYLPTPVVDARLTKIADTATERPSTSTLNQLGNAIGITFARRVSIADAIAEILMDHGKTDGTRWRGIRGQPSKARSAHEIWLGELGRIWFEAVPPTPSTQSYTETWPTNGTTIATGQDHPWTVVRGTPTIASQKFTNAVSSDDAAALNSLLDTASQRHTADFTLQATPTGLALVTIKVRDQGQDNNNHYRAQAFRNTGPVYQRLLRKRVAGTNTNFYSDTTDPGTSGVLEVTMDGSTVTMTIGAFFTSQTDASPSLTSNRQGACDVQGVVVGDATLDNNVIADIVTFIARRNRLINQAPNRAATY